LFEHATYLPDETTLLFASSTHSAVFSATKQTTTVNLFNVARLVEKQIYTCPYQIWNKNVIVTFK